MSCTKLLISRLLLLLLLLLPDLYKQTATADLAPVLYTPSERGESLLHTRQAAMLLAMVICCFNMGAKPLLLLLLLLLRLTC
jgi:hypothetical protein